MMRIITLACVPCLILAISFQVNAQKRIEEVFPLQWKQKIGLTNFRTNIVSDKDGNLYIGSNGEKRGNEIEKSDGVYVLNGKSGKIIRQITPKEKGDNDVSGLAISETHLYFGTDNGYFYKYTLDGKLEWKVDLSSIFEVVRKDNDELGDVESAPALADLNLDRELDVVFAAEGCGIVALDGKEGKLLWKYELVRRPGTYMSSPLLCDLNGDKVADVVAGIQADSEDPFAYGHALAAFNGRDGKILWMRDAYSNIHASPIAIQKGNDLKIYVAESYSDINTFDKQGKLLKVLRLNEPGGGISGLFSTPAITNEGKGVIGSSWWGNNDLIWHFSMADTFFRMDKDTFPIHQLPSDGLKYHASGKTSASAICADLYGKGKLYFAIPSEKGELFILDNNGNLYEKLILPAGTECTPFIKDVNLDRYHDLLIATNDGYLYCYKTPSRGRILVGQLFFNNQNTKFLRY